MISELRRLYKERVLYNGYEEFTRSDRALRQLYRFRNAYAMCRRAQNEGRLALVHPYGETPLQTAEAIGRAMGLSAKDTFFELGAGRGRLLIFMKAVFGCDAIGIEQVAEFVRLGQQIGIPLYCEDYFESDLDAATAIYLYGSTLSRAEIMALCHKLRRLPLKPKIATVSYPLSQYDPHFATVDRLEGEFPWGKTDIFISQLI